MFCEAFVTEGLKPVIPGVITFGAWGISTSASLIKAVLFLVEILTAITSYIAQRGNLPVFEDVCESGMAIMPMIGRARVLRNWGGIMDMSMDGSPIIDKTPIDRLYLNAGWCYRRFSEATPASGLIALLIFWRVANHTKWQQSYALTGFNAVPCLTRAVPGCSAKPALID